MGRSRERLPVGSDRPGRLGVKVQVGGTQASTDGTTIRLPEIRDTPVATTLAWGYLTHEAAHVRFTDMAVYRVTAMTHPLVNTVLNILEDVRIENAILGPYPGFVKTLDATLEWLVREGRTTASTADLAERIVALVEQEATEPPPSAPASDDDGAGEQAPDDEAGAGDPAPGDEDAAGDQALGDDDAAGDQEPGGTDADGRSALRAILAAGEDDLPEDLFAVVAAALNAQRVGTCTPLLPSVEDYEGDPALGQTRLAAVKGESAKLAARLQGLVQAHDMAKTRTARRGRALSTRHLHRAAVGDDRIFQRTDQRMTPNTAVHLLIDLSGSMAGGADRIALDAAMSLALALEPMRGVSCAVTAFPSLGGEADTVTRITSHGERVAARAGAFVQHARGGTPMTGALWYAAADLLARQEERRVILTLTDGAPDDWGSASAMVIRAGAAGIEMIGVGIATSVDRLFPVAVQIASVAELKGELFRMAERLLLK